MKLNALVITLLLTSLTTDVFPGDKRQASDPSDQAEQPPQKQARTDAPAADAPICSICLQTEEDENGIFMTAAQASQLLTCAHREFHAPCLTQALAERQRCPLCRQAAVGADNSEEEFDSEEEEEEDAPEITLNEAVAQGNLEAVQALLADPGINVNAADAEGNTALHEAAYRGNIAAVQALLHAGANVNAANTQRRTPLHWASTGDYVAVVQALLADPGINVNAADAQGNTALHFAALLGHVAVAQALLHAGANVNAADAQRRIPLHWASIGGYVAVVQALIAVVGINVNAADAAGNTPLHTAAEEGRAPAVQALIDAGADRTIKNHVGRTAADIAVSPAIRTLIEQYRTPAVGADDSEEDDDAPEITLNEAVVQNNLGAVRALLAAGANVNAADTQRRTPLHWASIGGYVALVQALLAALGINVNAATAQGFTPLHFAAFLDHVAVVQALLAAPGINVNATDYEGGDTPLHEAARLGYVAVVQALLNAGADITIRNHEGRTAAQVTNSAQIRAIIEPHRAASRLLDRCTIS